MPLAPKSKIAITPAPPTETFLPFLYRTRTILRPRVRALQRRQYVEPYTSDNRRQPRYEWTDVQRFRVNGQAQRDGEGLRIVRWRGKHKDERQADPAYRQRLTNAGSHHGVRVVNGVDGEEREFRDHNGYAEEGLENEDLVTEGLERDTLLDAQAVEDDALLDEPATESERRPRESTITATERGIFEKMFKQMGESSSPAASETIDGANEPPKSIWSEDAPKNIESLDSILEKALKSSTATARRKGALAALQAQYPKSLQDLADKAYERRRAQQRQEDIQRAAETIGAPTKEAARIERLLHSARTDFELWQILETHVFAPMRALNLDGEDHPATPTSFPQKSAKPSRRRPLSEQPSIASRLDPLPQAQPEDPSSASAAPPPLPSKASVEASLPDFSIIGPVYPTALLLALRILRRSFPTSSLALSILPAIKSLGRSSYALGATTQLYDELLSLRWLTYADFQSVDALLHEMDDGAVAMDGTTLGILEAIERDAGRIRGGEYGRTAKLVWAMERMKGGLGEVRWWRETVRKRLEEQALEEARERERRAREGMEDEGRDFEGEGIQMAVG